MRIILFFVLLFFYSCQSEQKEDLIRQREIVDSIDREIDRLNKEIEKEKKEVYKIIIIKDSIISK